MKEAGRRGTCEARRTVCTDPYVALLNRGYSHTLEHADCSAWDHAAGNGASSTGCMMRPLTEDRSPTELAALPVEHTV